MRTIGAYEAKTKLPELLERVAKGEEVTISKHGTPVAKLVPVPEYATCKLEEVILELSTFRSKRSLKGLSLRKLRSEGAR